MEDTSIASPLEALALSNELALSALDNIRAYYGTTDAWDWMTKLEETLELQQSVIEGMQ